MQVAFSDAVHMRVLRVNSVNPRSGVDRVVCARVHDSEMWLLSRESLSTELDSFNYITLVLRQRRPFTVSGMTLCLLRVQITRNDEQTFIFIGMLLVCVLGMEVEFWIKMLFENTWW